MCPQNTLHFKCSKVFVPWIQNMSGSISPLLTALGSVSHHRVLVSWDLPARSLRADNLTLAITAIIVLFLLCAWHSKWTPCGASWVSSLCWRCRLFHVTNIIHTTLSGLLISDASFYSQYFEWQTICFSHHLCYLLVIFSFKYSMSQPLVLANRLTHF